MRTAVPGFEDISLSRRFQIVIAVCIVTTLVALVRLAAIDVYHRNPMFHPHGYCYLWQTGLVSAHVVSDLVIGGSYFTISITLAYLVLRARRDIPFGWMMLAFGGFIIACGTTHLMEVVTLWQPIFWIAADVKIVTAIASVGAAALLPPIVPRALTLIDAARKSESRRVALERANAELEERVSDRTAQLQDALTRERQLRHDAESASRVKDEFLAIVSHELRTPLNAILGWTEMLRRGTLSPEAAERALASVTRNARAQAHLIEDLLDISRTTSGTLVIQRQPVSLAPVIEDAIDTIRVAAESRHIGLSFTANHAVWVAGDARRLQQIAWNLLSNAVKFTPEGGSVDVRLEADATTARLIVSDTGVGIDPQFVPHLFEPFRQADASATRAHGGLGLGLALVRRLAELHGGEVRAVSAGRGAGATFIVALPIVHSPHDASAGEPPPLGFPDLSGLRVLAADDRESLELVVETLRQCGAEVTVAASAADALERAVEAPHDLIVSGLSMPGVDGFDLLRRLRERGVTAPAVALTPQVGSRDRARVLAAGYRLHVAKPVAAFELAWAVDAARERSR